MTLRLFAFTSLSILLLCQCATKHQPIRFPATFQKYPEDIFSSNTLQECRLLEIKESPTPFDKKRLMELYLLEAKHLKFGSERFQTLLEKTERIRSEIEPLINENETIKTELFLEKTESPEEIKNNFVSPNLKKSYSQIYQLWNKDENERALNKVRELVANTEIEKNSAHADWLKVLNLHFKITHDVGEVNSIIAAYQKIKDFDSCSPEAANAALLLALTQFSKKESAKAFEILNSQCDKDDSLSSRTRKTYWLYRFAKLTDPILANTKLQELKALPLPGYYLYLAQSEKGEGFDIPAFDVKEVGRYLNDEFSVPSSLNQYLLKAEARLGAGLNKDANLYLAKSVLDLKDNPEKNLLPLLYIARLYRATGNHLESMKTFSLLIGGKKNPDSQWTPVIHSQFLEMFPRPYQDKVSWLAKEWNIDEDFIYSIMRQESAFNPGAVSATDARGLMQMMPSLARSLSQSWRYHPYSTDKVLFQAEENLKLSTYHLHQLQLLAPHYALIAASYNAGLKRTSRWWQKFGDQPLDIFVEFIPVSETRNYVKLVLRNFLYYKALRTQSSIPANFIPVILPEYHPGRTVSSKKH